MLRALQTCGAFQPRVLSSGYRSFAAKFRPSPGHPENGSFVRRRPNARKWLIAAGPWMTPASGPWRNAAPREDRREAAAARDGIIRAPVASRRFPND
jgi:hypothetical protein